jgi:hypothetical protein
MPDCNQNAPAPDMPRTVAVRGTRLLRDHPLLHPSSCRRFSESPKLGRSTQTRADRCGRLPARFSSRTRPSIRRGYLGTSYLVSAFQPSSARCRRRWLGARFRASSARASTADAMQRLPMTTFVPLTREHKPVPGRTIERSIVP